MPQCATVRKYGQDQPEARRQDAEKLAKILKKKEISKVG